LSIKGEGGAKSHAIFFSPLPPGEGAGVRELYLPQNTRCRRRELVMLARFA
jgi:hypothetical protein